MADISNIIYSKYIQATRALNKHAIKVSNNLGSGIKSKERMRKFNLMSAWLDLLGAYVNRPRHSKGASVPSVFLTDFTFEAYNSLQLACDIEDSIGGHTWIFVQFSEFAPNYNVYQEFYAAVLGQKQNGDWAEGVTVHKNDTLKQDPVLTTIAYDNISKAQFLEKLDLIAIELGIVYDLSEDLSLTISEIDN